MGDRASYAIREDGIIAVFYANWGAATLLADVFWGPATCEAAIRAQEAATTWLDDVYGEAAVAMCKDTRTLAFYDCRYDEETCQTAANMMERLWPGWSVRSARYVSGVAAHVGVDLMADAAPTGLTAFEVEATVARLGRLAPGELPSAGLILRRSGEGHEIRVCNENLISLLRVGPRMLEAIDRLPALNEVRRSLATRPGGEDTPRSLFEADPALLTIDDDRKSLRITIGPYLGVAGDLAALRDIETRWPGWTISKEVGQAEVHFAHLNETVPPDLVPVPKPTPLEAQLEVLARQLLGAEAFKAWAKAWLGRAEATVGIAAGAFTERAPSPRRALDNAERLHRFKLALPATGASESAIRRALARANSAAQDGVVEKNERADEQMPAGAPRLGMISGSLVRLPDGHAFAIHQPMDGGVAIGAATLLHWSADASSPKAFCPLTRTPIGTPSRVGIPGRARLHLAPSGRALLAVVETHPFTLIWVDLDRAEAHTIGFANRLADFKMSPRIAWMPHKDRFALEVADQTSGRFEHGCIVVYDAERGWLAELIGSALGSWTGAWPIARRAEIVEVSYIFVDQPWEHADDSASLAQARMTGRWGDGATSTELDRRSASFHSDRLTVAAIHAEGGHDALRAAEHAKAAFETDASSTAAFDIWQTVLFERQAWQERTVAARRHLALRPEHEPAWEVLTRTLMYSGDHTAAVEAGSAWTRRAPHDAAAHWNHAWTLAVAGKLEAAAAAAERAAEWAPERTLEIATDEDLRALRGHPDFRSFDYLRLLAEAADEEAPDAARALLSQATAQMPERPEAYEQEIWRAREQGLRAEALEILARWRAVDPDGLLPRQANIMLLVDGGNFEAAERESVALVAEDAGAFRAHIQLARVWLARGDEDASAAALAASRVSLARGLRPSSAEYREEISHFPELENML